MNYMEHIADAEMFLDTADILMGLRRDRAAAEMIWGAAVQAIDAANHRRTQRHLNHRGRLDVVQRLQDKYGLSYEFSDMFRNVRGALHNYFYTGRLSESDFAVEFARGRRFVSVMIELAHREHADAPPI